MTRINLNSMEGSWRPGVVGSLAVAVGVVTYQWMRNDALAFGRVSTWGGWLLLSAFFYVAWGVVERHLRAPSPEVVGKTSEPHAKLLQRSPGAWQWVRIAVVAYGSAVINALTMNQIWFVPVAPWFFGLAASAIFLTVAALLRLDPDSGV
jgi:hypothetical protein